MGYLKKTEWIERVYTYFKFIKIKIIIEQK